MDPIKLTVTKAYPIDSGKGITRLDPTTIHKLRISVGDVIIMEGKKKTAAKVWRADRQDWGKDLIRIDGFTRQNAGVALGDGLMIAKVDPEEAVKVVLAPIEGQTIQLGGEANNLVKRQILKRALVEGDVIPVMSTMAHPILGHMKTGQTISLIAVEVEPKGVVVIRDRTVVELQEKPASGYDTLAGTGITYEDLGGLNEQIQRLREMIELPLKHPEIFNKLGIKPPQGVLMYGPPGTGKTMIAKAVANESGAKFFSLAGPEIMSKYHGESEQRLRDIFEEATKNAPSIIFIDELDAIASKREESVGEVERRVVAQLLTLMDGVDERGQVVIIGATNRVNAIDPALRRPGRFDREIEITVPNRDERVEILQIHTRGMPLAEDVDLEKIADNTHGFVGADLAALSKESAMKALRRHISQLNLDQDIPQEVLNNITITVPDFNNAQMEAEPSAMREVLVEIPTVTWNEVGGLQKSKQEILESIEWPLGHPERFKEMGIRPPKGILLYGPPGTGKTLIARAVATRTNANFISIRGPQLLSRWMGESEKAIREIFKKARQVAPCIIFFDELDAMAPVRTVDTGSKAMGRIVNQLLVEIDGLEVLKDVVVVAATNRPDMIDPALIRSGRFDRAVFIGPPSQTGREDILKIHMRNIPVSEDVSISEIAHDTKDYVGADLEAICREAVMIALREDFNMEQVKMVHFKAALKKVRPALDEYIQEYYQRIEAQFKGGAPIEQKSYIGYR
ncbi:MAG: CDC48 family AAA ATPase [Methanosarcinales archaeon]|nr:CDC48 family AAA ATPase [Methanosarcinales archaeon]